MSQTRMTPNQVREKRLKFEFQQMLAIRRPEGLIDFRCADLTAAEASAFLSEQMTFDVISRSLPDFLSPEQYRRRFPDRPPEKYLIMFLCNGLVKSRETGEIEESGFHLLEIVFGLDYPSVPPRFVWLTPIWHPNIDPPYLCPHGRPFAVGTTLDQLCLFVGQMIQYRSYNVKSPLNREAAEWASAHPRRFPVDTRGLLDGREQSRPLTSISGNNAEWTTTRRSQESDNTASSLIDFL